MDGRIYGGDATYPCTTGIGSGELSAASEPEANATFDESTELPEELHSGVTNRRSQLRRLKCKSRHRETSTEHTVV